MLTITILMDIKNIFYVCMLLAQAYSLSRIIGEAKACKWSAQSRWIAWRMGGVAGSIMILTALSGWVWTEKDNLFDWIIIVALVAMTVLLTTHVPMITKAMSDKEVGENLNIKK